LLGVFIALLIVSDIKLNEIFSVTTLGDLFSLMFFGWFVAVFIWLATRALPKGGNLVTESQIIVLDACQKLFNAFKLKNLK
jgi:1,4-dihydroxy-2-naphthoate octaprenyltransferase